MNIYLLFFIMAIAGFGVGMLYFAGLLKTLDNVVTKKKNIKIWIFFSFLVRSSLLIGVFFLFSQGDWRRVAAMVVGFMIARIYMVRRIKAPLKVNNKNDAS